MQRTTLTVLDAPAIAKAVDLVYEDYPVRLPVTPEWVTQHVLMSDIDLAHSPLWLAGDGSVIGLAMLGVRGDRGWVGGFGISPEYRGRGLSHELIETVLDIARDLSLRRVQLEVLVNNPRAIRAYERAGFVHHRDLLILVRDPDAHILDVDVSIVEPVDPVVLLDQRHRLNVAPPVWQREPASLARLPDLQALAAGSPDAPEAFAIYRVTDRGVRLVDVGATDSLLAQAAIAALVERAAGKTLTLVNEPEGGNVLPVLLDAGWREETRQHEMLRDL